MVKADPKRNYYADLELGPTATTDDIKKQFRNLARVYHPDRNPGRELEFVPKFQAIQAAHEVLGDPEQRAKYDADRRRLGYNKASPKSNNPFRTTRPTAPSPWAQWPRQERAPSPPKAHAQTPRYTRDRFFHTNPTNPYAAGATPTAAPGAARFNVPRQPPGTSNARNDPPRGSSYSTAWERMKPATPSGSPYGSGNPYASYGQFPYTEPKGHRKSGFNPKQPGDFWEPPAPQTSSYNTRAPPHAPEPPPAAPEPPRRSSGIGTKEQPQRRQSERYQPTVEDDDWVLNDRKSAPYTSHGGERLYFNTDDLLKRSTSVREPARAPGGGARFEVPDSSPRDDYGAAPRARSASPKPRNRSGAPSPRHPPPPHTQPRVRPPVIEISSDESSSDESTVEEVLDPALLNRKKATPRRPTAGAAADARRTPPGSAGVPRRSPQSARQADEPAISPREKRHGEAMYDNPFFNVSNKRNDQFEKSFSGIPDTINTKFSQHAWNGKFEAKTFEPGPTPTAAPTARRPSKARASPTRTPAPTNGGMKSNNPFAPKADQPSNDEDGVKFKSEFWKPRFKEPTFVLPTNPPPAGGKSGAGAAQKKTASTPNVSRTRSSSTANNPAPPNIETVVIEDSPTPPARSPAPAQGAAPAEPFSPDGGSSDAMDIDTDEIPPPPPAAEAPTAADREPRNVQVPTSRPDWGDGGRASAGAGGAAAASLQAAAVAAAVARSMEARAAQQQPTASAIDPQLLQQTTTTTMPRAPPLTPSMPSLSKKRAPLPSTPVAPPPPTAGPASTSPTSPTSPHLGRAKSTLNLSSLRPSLTSVAGSPPHGGDGSSPLPSFLSQPSPRHPSAPAPGPLAMPRAPVPPAAPAARRLSRDAWRAHVAAMSAYMGEWWAFEERVLRHLDARHAFDARFGRGVPSTAATRLLEAQGEPGGQGVEAYVEARVQDRMVREGWMAACDRHERCVAEFAATKRRVKTEGFVAV